MTKRGNKQNRPRGPMQVQVVPGEDGGGLGPRIERILRAAGESQGDVMVVCNSFRPIPITAASSSVYMTFDDLAGSDEFASMTQQFRLFKVSHMKVTVVDMNPQLASTPNAWSTVHSRNPTGFLYTDVIDQTDSQVMAPGTSKLTFYWSATSLQEKEFQGVVNFVNWGGLVGYVDGGTPVPTKYMLVAKYVVHFRGRV